MPAQLYPQIRDSSTLAGVFNRDTFMVIGVEGQKDAGGTAVVGTPVIVSALSDADTLFGPASSLSTLVKFLLSKGVEYVVAVASASAALPTLIQRQAAWTALEEDPTVRIRLTDSVLQAELVALADSAEWAEGIQNKQWASVGMATPSTSASAITAAAAVASKRAILVSPGVYDDTSTLRSGAYAAAWVATRVALNPNIADDLDLTSLPGSTGIEKAASGMPIYRLKAGAGTPVNDFEVLLQGGVSPLKQGEDGSAQIVHLRTTYSVDSSYDALMTLLIKDQLFLDIRDILQAENFLRRGNTAFNQSYAAKLVQTYLEGRSTGQDAWINPVIQPDGKLGFGVSAVPSADQRNLAIHATAQIVRNLQTIDINNVLTIPS